MRNHELILGALICLPIHVLAAPDGIDARKSQEAVNDFISSDPKKSQQGMQIILASTESAKPALINALKNKNAEQRLKVLRMLRGVKGSDVNLAASNIAKSDPHWMVRTEALDVVARSPDAAGDTLLEEVALKDSDRTTRSAALRWYSHRRKNGAVSLLKKLLSDKDILIQVEAAKELGRQGDDSGYVIAKSQLSNKDLYIRSAAVESLGTIAKESDIQTLRDIEANKTEHQHVRVAAAKARKKIEFRSVAPDAQLEYLGRMLADDSWGVRSWAVDELFAAAKTNRPAVDDIVQKILGNPKHIGLEEAQKLSNLLRNRQDNN